MRHHVPVATLRAPRQVAAVAAVAGAKPTPFFRHYERGAPATGLGGRRDPEGARPGRFPAGRAPPGKKNIILLCNIQQLPNTDSGAMGWAGMGS